MQDGLCRRDRDDEIGLDERGGEAEREPGERLERDELLALDVVDDQPAAEAPAELGRHKQPDLARRGAAAEPARDEDRHVGDAEPVELVDGRGDRLLARVGGA